MRETVRQGTRQGWVSNPVAAARENHGQCKRSDYWPRCSIAHAPFRTGCRRMAHSTACRRVPERASSPSALRSVACAWACVRVRVRVFACPTRLLAKLEATKGGYLVIRCHGRNLRTQHSLQVRQ